MTSWILPEKEKPPSVDSDFSCIVLTVYKLTRNDFHSSTADVVHPLHPQHLIFRFEGFRNALFFGKLLYQPRKRCFCLLVEVCKVSLSSSALSNGSSNIMATGNLWKNHAWCKKPNEEWVRVSSKWKAGKQYSIKRMMGGRVIEANTDFFRYLICHLPSAGAWIF